MKRYLLFCFDNFYPMGGWNDFVGSFDKVEEAMEAARIKDTSYFQVIDSITGNEMAGNR